MSSKTTSINKTKKRVLPKSPISSKEKSMKESKVKDKTPTEKVKDLQEENDALKMEVLMLRCDLHPKKIEEKIRRENIVTEENVVSMYIDQIRQLHYQLQQYESSGAKSSTNDTELQQKIDKLTEQNTSRLKEITTKDKMIKTLEGKVKEFENLAAARAKDIEQHRKTGDKLKIENADLKKNLGQTESELQKYKNRLPQVLATRKTLEGKVKEFENLAAARAKDIEQHRKTGDKLKIENADLKKNLGQTESELQKYKNRLPQVLATRATTNTKNSSQHIDEEKLKDLKNKIESKDMEISNRDDQVKQQATEIEQLKADLKMLQEKQRNAEKPQHGTTADLKEAKTQVADELQKKIDEVDNLKKELTSVKSEIDQLQQEKDWLKKSNIAEQITKETKEETSDQLKEEVKSLKEKLTKSEKSLMEAKANLKSKTETQAADQLKQKTDEINKLENDFTELKRRNDELKSEKEQCMKIIQKLRKEKSTGDTKLGSNANVETKSLVEELKIAKDENADLKNRLRMVVGASIMNDNPNIPDLSDENRPTKLSEKFSDLYDNEWTDAYEEAEDELKSEEERIAYLYKILEDIFDFCKSIFEEYAKNIKSCVLTVPHSANGRPKSAKISVTNLRQLKELRKGFAPYLVESVFQQFVKTEKTNLAQKKNTEKFMKKCVEICWLMNSQDPPVVIDRSNEKGKGFDGDKFRTYTKSGKVVDFVVWPPMLLHEEGPLLCKGVAQGK